MLSPPPWLLWWWWALNVQDTNAFQIRATTSCQTCPYRFRQGQQRTTYLKYQTTNNNDASSPLISPPPQQQQQVSSDAGENSTTATDSSSSTAQNQLRPPVRSTPSYFVTPDELQTLKESVDLVDVVESYNLPQFSRKSHDKAMAICPFHDDHNPSLHVDSTRGLFKCFACGAGGDVFGFVRQMHQVEHGGDELTFPQAVRYVQDEFAGDHLEQKLAAGGAPRQRRRRPFTNRTSNASTPNLRHVRERIEVANAAAAAFYVDALRRPASGGARHYLTVERGFSPAVLRRFSLGFAPDAYFGTNNNYNGWGQGGLVEHLYTLNFTAQEIVDAGLATVVTRRLPQPVQTPEPPPPRLEEHGNATLSSNQNDNTTIFGNATTPAPEPELSVSDIMDRFRNRIVVPILDAEGKRVLGFGGRTLPSSESTSTTTTTTATANEFEGPKYLNTPKTLVFHKQHILFGQHLAGNKMNTSSSANSLVLVEGYLDAVSLSSVGVNNVVATMGTAITLSQLELAAEAMSEEEERGTVILCMDNDVAGQAAVERVCREGMILHVVSQYPSVQFRVATPPAGIKDPADFVDNCRRLGKKNAGNLVCTDILNVAIPWNHWYVGRIVNDLELDFQSGNYTAKHTNRAFQKLAGLISECTKTQERSDLAQLAAGLLAPYLEGDNNKTESQKRASVAIDQLESDLMHSASRMEAARNITSKLGNMEELSQMFHYGHVHDIPDSDKLSQKALSNRSTSVSANPHFEDYTDEEDAVDRAQFEQRSFPRSRKGRPRNGEKRKLSRKSRHVPEEPVLTPHFAGFSFQHQTDLDWLESTGNGQEDLVLSSETLGKYKYTRRKKRNVVYFNSNDYHGRQFITQEAIDAGYSGMDIKKDPDVFKKGVACLVQPNADLVELTAENALLREMILNPAARTFVKNWMQTRDALHGEASLDFAWSCPEKKWLLETLLTDDNVSSAGAKAPDAVRDCLAVREDVPVKAFFQSSVVDGANDDDHFVPPISLGDEGVLDYLFVSFSSSEDELSSSSPAHIEYYLQDLLGGMLWASAKREAEQVESQLLLLSNKLLSESNSTSEKSSVLVIISSNETSNVTQTETNEEHGDLQSTFDQQVHRLNQAAQRLRYIEESRRRASTRAVDSTSASNVEGRICTSSRAQLCSEVEDFTMAIGRQHVDRIHHHYDDVPIDVVMERIENQWGDWNDEEFMWSPNEHHKHLASTKQSMQPQVVFEEEEEEEMDEGAESLEEELESMDNNWANWL